MPMHLSSLFSAAEMNTAVMSGPFDFTKGMPVMRIDALKDASSTRMLLECWIKELLPFDSLADRPETLYVAQFIGPPAINVWRGTLDNTDGSHTLLRTDAVSAL